MLEKKLNEDLKNALKAKDAVKLSVIRMLKADITNAALKLKKKALGDDEVLKIIRQHISKHKDSIEQFKKGNRDDLVQKEEKELAILKAYMPQQLSDSELEKLVKSTIEELGATTKKEMGKVIKAVLEAAKDKADGKRVSQIASQLLTG